MRISHWVMPASLFLTLLANAQQSTNPSSFPAAEQMPASDAQSSPALSRRQLDSQPSNAAPQPVATSASDAPAPASASASSSTMDQVVDRAIEREHALMEMLKTRTPFVETYLQNLKFDPH